MTPQTKEAMTRALELVRNLCQAANLAASRDATVLAAHHMNRAIIIATEAMQAALDCEKDELRGALEEHLAEQETL